MRSIQFEQRVFPGSGAVDVSQVGLSAWQGLANVANGHRLAIHLRYSEANGHVRQQWVAKRPTSITPCYGGRIGLHPAQNQTDDGLKC